MGNVKGSIEYGAKQAVENCLKLKADERLIVITDKKTLGIGEAIKNAAGRITENIGFYVLEDFGKRPEDGSNPLKCPKELLEAFEKADASIYCAQGKKNELESLRKPLMKAAFANKVRHAHMPDITKEIMETGMSADYSEVERLSKTLYDIVRNAKKIHITTEKGTDITAEFDSKLEWVCSYGVPAARDPAFCNLPDGEVFTCPSNVNGHVVVDGCFGGYFNKKYGDISETPVEMDIEKGRVVKGSIKCANKRLEKELNDYVFNTDENSNRVGEWGHGTNKWLRKIIGNLLQDEKFPGFHFALGDPLGDCTKAEWKSKVHCDAVIKNVTIIVDGKTIMEKGKYLI